MAWLRSGAGLWLLGLLGLVLLPWGLQTMGDAWVRMVALALLYVLLALGLNMVVGYAGLLDLGFVAFYATGAYLFAWLASPHLWETFPALGLYAAAGLKLPLPLVLLLAGALAALVGALLGAPTLRLRGDYLAIVTLGFGEIIRIFLNNMEAPVNLTNGPRGIDRISSLDFLGLDLGQTLHLGGLAISPVVLHFYFFLALVLLGIGLCHRLANSPLGRAWMAVRDDEMAAKAVGLPVRRLKLMAFALGASFGGVAGVLFAGFQGFVSPESFSLQESVMIVAMVVLGGLGYWPGVVVGALLLAALPEVLRHVATPLQAWSGGRLDASILRQLLIALAMIGIMLWRPKGLWPAPSQQKLPPRPAKGTDAASQRPA
jgi:branched-chain amino acid transport system permease protein